MGKDRTTAIFSTCDGMVALDSPVKLKILELLQNGTASFDELVEKSRKAKSTISVHLHDLEESNLIQEKTFPNDKRKKYFVLNALYLAYSEIPLRSQYNTHLDNIAASALNGNSFKEKLFCTFRYGMEAYGIDPKPILKKLGNDIGIKIGPGFKSEDCEGILNELSFFWEYHRLGDMTVIEGNRLAVLVNNCHHCSKMPNAGKTLCSMDEGIIEGVLSSRLKLDCNVRETECNGTGHRHCKFVVEEKTKT
ncbi:MAG: ArsR family transcriptional regulator [Candidatus Methanoperedenaceae archaeon]|nr:ArsR family transcriptional regulator [Candidatus Methanoperedenaceae archaeon]